MLQRLFSANMSIIRETLQYGLIIKVYHAVLAVSDCDRHEIIYFLTNLSLAILIVNFFSHPLLERSVAVI